MFSWLRLGAKNSDGWSAITAGGCDFKVDYDVEILEQNMVFTWLYKVRHQGQICEMHRREIVALLTRLCKHRGQDGAYLISSSLSKYF